LVSSDLAKITRQLKQAFDMNPAHHDPQVADYGLINAVFPIGGSFLEVVQPVRSDASAERYLRRKGGDAGYMVIIQAGDAVFHRARLAELGVREIEVLETDLHFCTHFHPKDTADILMSIDHAKVPDWKVEDSEWHPAGRDWRRHQTPEVVGLRSLTIGHSDPDGGVARWAALLDLPASSRTIKLMQGRIDFVPADSPAVAAIEVEVRDVEDTLARAVAAGLPVSDGGVLVGGLSIVPAPSVIGA